MVRFGFADDYWQTYPAKLRSTGGSAVNSAAQRMLRPDRLVWVVVGDREKIEPGLRELGFGEIQLLDSEGSAPTGPS